MTNEKLQSMKKRIAKLLALSESSNANEAAVALGKARQLMLEYQIEEADVLGLLDKSRVVEITVADIPERFADKRNKRPGWVSHLAEVVAQSFSCNALLGYRQVYFFGTPEDLEIVEYTYVHLRERMNAMADNAVKAYADDYKRTYGRSIWGKDGAKGVRRPQAFRKSYLAGIISVLYERLAQAKTAEPQTTTAIVLQRQEAIHEYITNRFDRIGKGRATLNFKNGGGYVKGQQDGRSMQIHRGVGTDSAKRQLT